MAAIIARTDSKATSIKTRIETDDVTWAPTSGTAYKFIAVCKTPEPTISTKNK